METVTAIFWKRLDVEGHDACRLLRRVDGWSLSGAASFSQDGEPCALRYSVSCDLAWRSLSGSVDGWLGERDIHIEITRSEDDRWLLNGGEQPQPHGCVDLDLGFTPATNLMAVRRLGLLPGQQSDAPAAYLAFPRAGLQRLEQTYRRIDSNRYAYTAPAFEFETVLTVSSAGFITDYPGLWRTALPVEPDHP